MYLPDRFKAPDIEASLKIIELHPFATLISQTEKGPFVSHLPLLLEKVGQELFVIGHMAKANPHSTIINEGPAYVIFHGPHAYISPRWYAEHDVPTWNYAIIHIQGQAQIIEDYDGTVCCLKKLSERMDPSWEFSLPEDLGRPEVLMRSIVGFRIKAENIKGKFKLGQNRSEADKKGVLEALKAEGHPLVELLK